MTTDSGPRWAGHSEQTRYRQMNSAQLGAGFHWAYFPSPRGTYTHQPFSYFVPPVTTGTTPFRPYTLATIERDIAICRGPIPVGIQYLQPVVPVMYPYPSIRVKGTGMGSDIFDTRGYTRAIGNANVDEKESTTGLVFISREGGAILWKAKKQTLSVLSTTEAEYIALAHAGTEAGWFRNLYTELGFPPQSPLPIRCDNWGTISMTRNPHSTQRSPGSDRRFEDSSYTLGGGRDFLSRGKVTP